MEELETPELEAPGEILCGVESADDCSNIYIESEREK